MISFLPASPASASLAFTVSLREKAAGAAGGIVPASNAFVITTLAVLIFTLGCFMLWFWLIWRKKKQPHLRLLIELHEKSEGSGSPGRRDPLPQTAEVSEAGEKEEQSQPWERPADWWRK